MSMPTVRPMNTTSRPTTTANCHDQRADESRLGRCDVGPASGGGEVVDTPPMLRVGDGQSNPPSSTQDRPTRRSRDTFGGQSARRPAIRATLTCVDQEERIALFLDYENLAIGA